MRLLVLGTACCVVLAGCTVGPSQRPAVVANDGRPAESETDPVPLPPLVEQEGETIDWSPCDDDFAERLDAGAADDLEFSCASVYVPADGPGGSGREEIRLSLVKAQRPGAEQLVPLLAVNDVDGEPGTSYAARVAGQLPEQALETFSVIGVDRRGTGDSHPISCIEEPVREDLLSHDPVEESVATLVDSARKAGQLCAIDLGTQQSSFDAWHTAADLEAIRAHLGIPNLHAIASGEGSRVLGVYAARYTDRVGRVVLDGVPDPAEDTQAVLEGVAQGAERTLDAYADVVGGDARDDVTSLVEKLRDRFVRAEDGLAVGPSVALYAILTGLADPDRWDDLEDAVDLALDGEVDELAAFLDPMLRGSDAASPTIDAAVVTICNDMATRLTPDQIDQTTAKWREDYPLFGGIAAQRLAWCSPWPTRHEPLPGPEIDDAPPILVVSTAADPVTPDEGTTRAAQRMPTSIRIAWLGAGRGALGRSDCATEKIVEFLADGVEPTGGSLCPP